MSTALEIISAAYRQHNETEPTSFSTSLEFPLSVALDTLQETIMEMNRQGNLYFTETATTLTYSVGVYQYAMSSLLIDPRKVRYIRRTTSGYQGRLTQYDWSQFEDLYRGSPIQTTMPTVWSKFGDTLELDCIPDQDYTIKVYHYKDMPKPTATSDTFLVPVNDEDVLIDCCKFKLGAKIGRWSEDYALGMIKAKTAPFLVDVKKDAGIPRQMPRAF